MTPDRIVDAIGLLCPLPVLKARKVLNDMAVVMGKAKFDSYCVPREASLCT